MPWPLRFVCVVLVAGAGLAVGVGLLAPSARAMLDAGEAEGEKSLVQLEELAQRTEVFAADGTLLAVLKAEENRQPVSLDAVPEHVRNAILDVEDDRFWAHNGVDVRSTIRALRTNVSAGGIREGGSTITQQLVKNALLTPERSLNRKMREAVLAVRLEQRLSKREILERYLNTVYFGNGAYGVQAAAETYFNTDAGGLTVAQAALLAGIIRNPEGYDPVRNPDAARERRDMAFERMVVNRHLTREEADRLREEPLPAKVNTPLPPPDDYFVEEVKQRLLADRRLGETPQERYNALFKGGLKIHTTLDRRMQALAEAKVAQVLPDTRGRFTAATATVEPGTGYVRAMVAGKDFNNAKYNLATARGGSGRQPGSSFKPFVLLAALEKGHSPHDTIDGTTPCVLKIPGFAPYDVDNYEGSRGGVMSLTDSTVYSVNCAYVRLGAVAGLDRVIDVLDRLGMPKDRFKPFPSISLGAQEVSPLEMAAAYAGIANDGMFHPPSFVSKVEDRHGKVLFEGPNKGRQAVSQQHARIATQIMRQVVTRGTGVRAQLRGRAVAGKTGTSEEHQNAWFVGYTRQLATAVWMGAPAGNISMYNVGGVRVAGGTYPARIWSAFMGEAMAGMPALDFPAPNPRLIAGGRFINDRLGSRKPTSSTTRPPGATPLPPAQPATSEPGGPPTSAPPGTTTTEKKPPTTKAPTSTTEPPPTTAPPDDGGGGETGGE